MEVIFIEAVIPAFLLTFAAGMSTLAGSCIAFFSHNKEGVNRFLSVCLSFSAGVMIYVSMIEIYRKAESSVLETMDERAAAFIAACGFFGGFLLMFLVGLLFPEKKTTALGSDGDRLMKVGIYTAVAMGIHNFPEGLATFLSALGGDEIAYPTVIAIAIHNIPEGVAVSVPIFCATGSKRKAFLYSFLSGLAEPVGAVVGYLLLMPYMNGLVYGIVFAFVAGIMVYICFDELIPLAEEYGGHKRTFCGIVSGFFVIAVSLILLK